MNGDKIVFIAVIIFFVFVVGAILWTNRDVIIDIVHTFNETVQRLKPTPTPTPTPIPTVKHLVLKLIIFFSLLFGALWIYFWWKEG